MTVIGTGRANAEGLWTIGSGILGEGLHDIRATTVDVAGNTGVLSAVQQVRIDTTAPYRPDMPNLLASMDSGTSDTDNVTNATMPIFDGLAEANVAVTLYDGSTVIGTGFTDATGSWSIKAAALSSGVHLIRARLVDLAGNTSLFSGSLKVVIDTQAGAAPDIGRVTIPGVYGTAAPGSTVTLFDGANLVSTGLANKAGNWLVQSALGSGQHTLTATAVDVAGNATPVSTMMSALIGTRGNDLLSDSGGVTRMAGGEGSDSYYVGNSTDIVVEAVDEGTDTVFASVGYALAADSRIEFLRANAGSVGLALTGNEFANTIVGDAGNDTVRGGGGADVLTGGGGQNLFVIATLVDSTVAASGRDLITDFSETTGDRIDLRLLDADTTVGLDQKFTFIGTTGFEGIAGQLRYADFGTATAISGDVNGDAVADFAILLNGSHTLGASNFLL
jgi:Ca2+-binding RTX toxin-like protein